MLELSAISLVGVLFYAVTALFCAVSARFATRARQPKAHAINWALVSLFFVGLMALRGLLIEDWIELTMRTALRESGSYGDRRQIQKVVAIILALIATGAATFWLMRSYKKIRGQRELAIFVANFACFAMVGLIGFRLLSLHAIDFVLYALKVNWIMDAGLTVLVGGCAAVYVRRVLSAKRPA